MHSSNGAVLLDAGFEFHQDRMTAAVAIKNFLTRQTDFDWPIEQQRSLSHDDFMIERVALSPETAAVGRGDHTNMSGRYFQHFGERAMDIMRSLRAGPDRQFSFRILDGDRSVLLDGKMGAPLKEKSVLENFICFGKAFFHVAKFQRHEFMNVSLFAIFVNPWLRSRQSFLGIGYRRKDFIIDID